MTFIKLSTKPSNSLYDSSPTLVEEPLFKAQKQTLILKKEKSTKNPSSENYPNPSIYDQFLTDLTNFSVKVGKGLPLNVFNTVNSRNLIYIGKNPSVKINLPGSLAISNSAELSGIILDANTLDINTDTGLCGKCDDAFYAVFFEYIRAAVITNQKLIAKDTKLDGMLQKLLTNIYLKALGSNVTLNDKQKIFLQYTISYFYYRFMKNEHHEIALSNSLSFVDSKIDSEAKFILRTFEKYTRMKDIFKAFVDFKIISESPAITIMKIVKKYNLFTFYCLTTSLDYLISLCIVSIYPTSFFESFGLVATFQTELEKYIATQYFPKVKYKLDAI